MIPIIDFIQFIILRAYPKRSIFTVFALLFSGLAEVVSFAAMIPLLGMAMFQDTGDKDLSFLESGISEIFDIFGLEMSMGGILVLIVLLMTLKSILSFYAMKRLDISALT